MVELREPSPEEGLTRLAAVASEFTIFIDNIPHALNPFGLKDIFRKAGDVGASYVLSRRGRRNRNRFGFIRFWNKRDALRSIIMFDNTIIRGSRIKVTMAKYGRGSTFNNSKTHTHTPLPPIRRILRKEVQQNNHWRQRLNQKEKEIQSNPRKSKLVESNPSDQHVLKTLTGEANEGVLEWLNRSIVCKSVEPQNLEVLTSALVNKHCSKICVLSKFNFILTYDTVE
ncbi:hypothetical protein Cgig2_016558 [Carnegiea gigantea]|uniref:RRM domain-containing protein n=1 Tax=Carnegiea gigantea TaxID=171969 RepID=A0A9Q1QRL1_9CARY|nr:hypothetical protein Cgig2_016558 [Carnegiea gigantea]